ncbi:E3 ubiquitin-protein ligase BRE1B-like, partial [Oxyura jamaicensis]|uniref:E3 ubiquitin-protein ligase BRE1B-like n=1 Tax=Oxyura jamaicensis TaxID=8884 RepID=UPI0015A5D457
MQMSRKAQESQKEMKLLLDMYKSAPKEQRDKVQLMAAERKSKAEAEELRGRARELEERERRESKKLADEEALRRLRQAEEQIEHLQRKLAATKQVGGAWGGKAQESQKEMKLLLDMYKSAPKEQRDKVQLMAAERKSKAE